MRRFNGIRQVSMTKILMNVVCRPNTISGGIVPLSRRNREKTIIYRNFEKMNITEQVKQKTQIWTASKSSYDISENTLPFLCSRRNLESYIITEYKMLEHTDVKNNRWVRVLDRNGALATLKRIIQHISIIWSVYLFLYYHPSSPGHYSP